MPTYLCHGFRWDRQSIRVFVAQHDLEDAAPDWIIGRDTSMVILQQLHKLVPSIGKPDKPIDLQGKDPFGQKVNPNYAPSPPSYNIKDDFVLCHDWSAIKLLESYAGDENEPSRPYAFVADYVVRVDQDCSCNMQMKYLSLLMENHPTEHGYMNEVKAELAPEEQLSWYVIVCADPVRAP